MVWLVVLAAANCCRRREHTQPVCKTAGKENFFTDKLRLTPHSSSIRAKLVGERDRCYGKLCDPATDGILTPNQMSSFTLN